MGAGRCGLTSIGSAAGVLSGCSEADSPPSRRRLEALARALERLRREQGLIEAPRLRELVDVYLAQHDGEPETVEKLRWLLAKAVRSFGHRRISRLRQAEIAAWRLTITTGHRFEATQALRQVLARAVS